MTRSRVPDDVKRELALTDKQFGKLERVLWFNRHGMGPFVASVCLRANVHPDRNYPNARISFGQWSAEPKEMDFGGLLLTVPQAIDLVKQLKAAIRETVIACPQLAIGSMVEDLDGEIDD